MTRLAAALTRTDIRIPGAALPLMSVSQTRGVVRRTELTDKPPRAESLDVYKVVRRGEIVFNKMSIRAGALGVAPEDGLVTYHYEVMKARPGYDASFLVHLMKSDWFIRELIQRERGIGAGDQANVRTTEVPFRVLKAIDVRLPSLPEQRAIVDFLDRETAKIDALIEKQHSLITLLQERRETVVERAITDGAWQCPPLYTTTSLIQTGPFGSQLGADEYVMDGVPVINPIHLAGGVISPDPGVSVSADTARRLGRHALQVNDVVAARRGELGRCAVVTRAAAGALCGTGSLLLRPLPSYVPRFLQLVFSSKFNSERLQQLSVGSTMPNLNAVVVGRLRLPCPSRDVQESVVSQIQAEAGAIDVLIGKTEEFIALAKERRAALITSAVTGQIDVNREAS